eukprot:TRINITY_DN12505_c0_g1_i6.p2 TRINITY_DN12505_c0_g1~~TRINITY_DN12505_c0_g1_i6.p2  ORF type:complete len:352 (+),score=163.65 TRINITY_DN12505_c0_g1_i6:244-1299(+)
MVIEEFENGKGVTEVSTNLAEMSSNLFDEREKAERIFTSLQTDVSDRIVQSDVQNNMVLIQSTANRHKLAQLKKEQARLQSEIPRLQAWIGEIEKTIGSFEDARKMDIAEYNVRAGEERATIAVVDELVADFERILADGLEGHSKKEFHSLLEEKDSELHKKMEKLGDKAPAIAALVEVTATLDKKKIEEVVVALKEVKSAMTRSLSADEKAEKDADAHYESNLAEMKRARGNLDSELTLKIDRLSDVVKKIQSANTVETSLEQSSEILIQQKQTYESQLNTETDKSQEKSKDWEKEVSVTEQMREIINKYGEEMQKAVIDGTLQKKKGGLRSVKKCSKWIECEKDLQCCC